MRNTKEVNRLNDKRKKAEQELNKMILDTDEISLTATVVNLKYSGSDTVVDFDIPADQIELLNKNRFHFAYYKMELEPIISRAFKTDE